MGLHRPPAHQIVKAHPVGGKKIKRFNARHPGMIFHGFHNLSAHALPPRIWHGRNTGKPRGKVLAGFQIIFGEGCGGEELIIRIGNIGYIVGPAG